MLGPTVHATSEFARCFLAARTAAGGAVTGGGDALFRLELPTGQALSDLVPAVGGGLRGLVRGADGRFAGQVRLMPAAAGVSGVAAGIALGVGALAVGAQMYYQAQLTATLAQIRRSGATVEQHLLHEMTARVDAAEEALVRATALLLDRADAPLAAGLDSAQGSLSEAKHIALQWLEGWEKAVTDLSPGPQGRPWAGLKKVLDTGPGGREGFAARVVLLRRALGVDALWQLMSRSQAALSQPENPLEHFTAQVSDHLQMITGFQERLGEVVWSLAEHPVYTSVTSLPAEWRSAARTHRELITVARALTTPSYSVPLLSRHGFQVLEGVQRADGSVRLILPAAA
jgi:hypothetical protein